MNDLHIDNQLPSAIVDDQDAHTASAIGKGTVDSVEQTVLVDNGQPLLDVASLGHADNRASLADVQDTVLLEDRAEHGLHNDRGRGIADERGLLVQLTGEQVYTEVSVLASLGRRGDADDLRGTALEKEYVTNADEVALDGHTAATEAWLDEADLLDGSVTDASGTGGLPCVRHNHLVTAAILVMVVVMREGVYDTVSSTLHPAAEAVVLAFVVVVTHVSFDRLVNLDFFLFDGDVGLHWTATFVFEVVSGIDASTVVSLGDVELSFESLVVALAAVVVDFDVIPGVSTVDFDVDVGALVVSGSVPAKKTGLSVPRGFQRVNA